MPRFKLIATLNIKIVAGYKATPLFPALIAPGYDPNSGGVELPGAAKESDRRERIANDPECLGDSRWVNRFSGDELAGRRGLSGGMA
ncbi:hypothetical protein [Cedecea lapagei]|uniref:hypothetical protein n=1 Tax=Cedecea lapagei TaxID=158823 RepID=UPI0013DFA643|nr:hypothetical protein [Cedecea lapagei]